MTKSYKMLVLEAMLNADRLPGSITIDELVQGVVRLAEGSARLASDLGVPLTDALAVRRHLEKNPIAAWESGAGTDGVAYFSYAGGQFKTTLDVAPEHRGPFQELVREIVEWRLAAYLDRTPPEEELGDQIVCKGSHSGGRPILFLRPRTRIPDRFLFLVPQRESRRLEHPLRHRAHRLRPRVLGIAEREQPRAA